MRRLSPLLFPTTVVVLAATLVLLPPVARAAEPATVVLQLNISARSITVGDAVAAEGRLQLATTGAPVVGEAVELQRRDSAGGGWLVLRAGWTDGQGEVSWRLHPRTDAAYRLRHVPTADFSRAESATRLITVQPRLKASLDDAWVRLLGRTKITGRLKSPLRKDRVVLELQVNRTWRPVARTNPGQVGQFRFPLRGWPARDTYRYRIVVPATETQPPLRSASLTLDVVRLVTYRVETRGRIVASLDAFKNRVAQVYRDPRGWSRANVRFRRVRKGGDFSVVLSQAKLVATFAPICDTYFSCRVGRYVVINQDRWRLGTPYFLSTGSTLRDYRALVVNHETGHWFGLGHATCRGKGDLAPVMMQQSKGLFGCQPNPWPLKGEIARVR